MLSSYDSHNWYKFNTYHYFVKLVVLIPLWAIVILACYLSFYVVVGF